MKSFSFIHAADLHIDSPFKGIAVHSSEIAQELRAATLKSYNNIIDLCLKAKVNFLVIAGDIYDGADRSIHAQLSFLEGLNLLADAGIRSFVAHGNHDPLEGWCDKLKRPDGTHVFAANRVESEIVSIDGDPAVLVAGISYQKSKEEQNLVPRFRSVDLSGAKSLFKIAVLHCNVGTDTGHENYAPCSLQDLTKSGFDYWALGHVHERRELSKNPWVVYPGNSQGRSIREQGARGCYLVKVNDRQRVDLEFIPTDVVRWFSSPVSIEGLETIDELASSILVTVDKLARQAPALSLICRVQLRGRGPLYHQLQSALQLQQLLSKCREKLQGARPFRWIEQLEFDCRPDVNLEDVRKRNDLASFVLKEADQLSEGHVTDLLANSLAPLYENPVMSQFLKGPDAHGLQKLIDEASLLCFDRLENG